LTAGSAQAVPGIEGDVWLTTGKALFHSTDSGKSFKALSNVDESAAVGYGCFYLGTSGHEILYADPE